MAEITEDGILCSILSSLTIRDAVRTSTLSSRWRHLSTYLPDLNFDVYNIFGHSDYQDISGLTMEKQETFLEKRSNKFIGCVNKFLQHHRGMGVKTLRVHFFLHTKHADHLDKWVDFGITSGAQHLTLILDDVFGKTADPYALTTDPYGFPCQLFTGGRGSSIEHLSLDSCLLSVPPNFDGFRSLKSLDLESVEANETEIQDLVSTCSVLEWLSVGRMEALVDLRISNPSGKLKYLCVQKCPYLRSIEVLAINLATFEYTGHMVSFLFRNCIQLARAYIRFYGFRTRVEDALTKLQHNLPLLKTLLLRINNHKVGESIPVNSSKFTHLEKLVMFISGIQTVELLWMTSFLSAVPFLKNFQLNILSRDLESDKWDGELSVRKLPTCHHNHLKMIEINGFDSSSRQIEFAIYLLNNSVALELMTISSSRNYYHGNFRWKSFDEFIPHHGEVRKKCFALLIGSVPPGAKLVIR